MTTFDPLTLIEFAMVAMAGWMSLLWVIQRYRRNASLADVGWCFGLVAVVAGYAMFAAGEAERKIVLLVMASVYDRR